MPTLLPPHPVLGDPAPRRRRRVRRRLVAAGIGLAVLVPVGLQVADWLPDNPLGQDVVDRSTPPLLLALEDLSEYHAATGTFQVVVDREVDTRYVPSVISGEQVSFLATGTADAYVDFEVPDSGVTWYYAWRTDAWGRVSAQRARDNRVFAELTDREREVLTHIGHGERNKEIAEALFISEKTVKNHISSIFFKLEVNSRAEAALLAARQGLV